MPTEAQQLPDVLTVPEAAELLRIDARTVIAMIDSGKLAAADIGTGDRREFRIARSAINELLALRRAPTEPPPRTQVTSMHPSARGKPIRGIDQNGDRFNEPDSAYQLRLQSYRKVQQANKRRHRTANVQRRKVD